MPVMGHVYVDFEVVNDRDPARRKRVKFLADSGASKAWVDRDTAEEVGIEEVAKGAVELADGRIVQKPYGFCKFVYRGEMVNGSAFIGARGSECLAGVLVLQELRLDLDLVHHRLVRTRAHKAK